MCLDGFCERWLVDVCMCAFNFAKKKVKPVCGVWFNFGFSLHFGWLLIIDRELWVRLYAFQSIKLPISLMAAHMAVYKIKSNPWLCANYNCNINRERDRENRIETPPLPQSPPPSAAKMKTVLETNKLLQLNAQNHQSKKQTKTIHEICGNDDFVFQTHCTNTNTLTESN